MAIKIKPTSTIVARLGLEDGGRVQKYFNDRCRIHMDKYVPYRDGNLRLNVSQATDGSYITYHSPYAHYQYEGILYVDPETGSSWARKDTTKVPTSTPLTYHTPGTGHHWDKRMWSVEGDTIIKELQDYIRR